MSSVGFRMAEASDLPAIVALLADDELGAMREQVGEEVAGAYVRAFEAIDADPNHELIVATNAHGVVIGVAQLTFIPTLTQEGMLRAQIEGVRVSSASRGLGLGEALIRDMIDRAGARGARVVQLTTDKRRGRALRFYERLGFRGTHEGLKLRLEPDARRPRDPREDTTLGGRWAGGTDGGGV
ncbi:MAG: GNAT family N-acetyltransferase [Planctomycetota bacterium]